jgi:RNA polymerase sigma factor (sigma-70 family)
MNYPTGMSDEQLIQFYLNGNPTAIATLVELYKDRIYCSIYTIVQDKHAAEDIFQEVFIRMINNMLAGKTAEEGNFLQWASSIAHSLCIEYTRKAKMAITIDNTTAAHHSKPAEVSVPIALPNGSYHESHNKLKSMIDMLPEEQREVMVLNHYAGLSLRDITDIMKCSLTTALDTMKFGLNNLRKMMQEKEVVMQS